MTLLVSQICPSDPQTKHPQTSTVMAAGATGEVARGRGDEFCDEQGLSPETLDMTAMMVFLRRQQLLLLLLLIIIIIMITITIIITIIGFILFIR